MILVLSSCLRNAGYDLQASLPFSLRIFSESSNLWIVSFKNSHKPEAILKIRNAQRAFQSNREFANKNSWIRHSGKSNQQFSRRTMICVRSLLQLKSCCICLVSFFGRLKTPRFEGDGAISKRRLAVWGAHRQRRNLGNTSEILMIK